MTQFTRAGTRHNFIGPGPGLIIQFAGRARAGPASLLRAHICGSDLRAKARPVQGPSAYACTSLVQLI